MSNWIYLEIAIGLVLVYCIVSLMCTAIMEFIARWLALRARTLSDGILNLINDDKGLFKTILNNPFFLGLSSKTKGKHWWDVIKIGKWEVFTKNEFGPSEIPPATFSQIIVDALIEGGDDNQAGYQNINTEIEKRVEDEKKAEAERKAEAEKEAKQLQKTNKVMIEIKKEDDEKNKDTRLQNTNQVIIENITQKLSSDKNLKLNYKKRKDESDEGTIFDQSVTLSTTNQQLLNSFLFAAKTKSKNLEDVITEFRKSLETWFDGSMQRVTGWYKRKTQLIILGVALILCFALNIDSFGLAKAFYDDPALRETVVAAAEDMTSNNATLQTANVSFNDAKAKLDKLNLPIGWNTDKNSTNTNPDTGWGWLFKIIGILVTALAASLGSSFWFDLLKKLVNIRSAGKTPEKTEETKSGSGG